MLLIAASGCGGGGTKPATPVRNSSETKVEVESKPAESGPLVTDQESGGPIGDQPPKDDAGAIEIPLGQIWALHMPGTKNIIELDPDGDYNGLTSLPGDERIKRWKNSLLRQISEALTPDVSPDWPREGQQSGPGFVVAGNGIVSLREANAVMFDKKKPRTSFSASTEVTAVFFSYMGGGPLQIMHVTRDGSNIVVAYRFIMPLNKGPVLDFALIPLGRLMPGKYQVEIRQLPMGQEMLDRTYGAYNADERQRSRAKVSGLRFVCHSFSFDVTKENND
jgi:hypothetical protein